MRKRGATPLATREDRIRNRWLLALILLLIAAFVFLEGEEDPLATDEHYCSMVEQWDASNGEWGWPPYQGREHCPAK